MRTSAPKHLLAGAAACVAAFAGLLVLAYFVGPTRWLDEAALHGFTALQRPWFNEVARTVAHLCDVSPYAVFVAITVAIALKTRGARTGIAVATLLVGANVTTQALKPLLAYHRELYEKWHLYNITDLAFPSGHATASMSLSLAALLIVPRAYRPLTALLGCLFTLAVSFSIVALLWHFPSDIVGGYLVATAWGLVTLAGLRFADARWPAKEARPAAVRDAVPAPTTGWLVLIGATVTAVTALTALALRADKIAGFADRHTAFVAVATAIALAAAVLLGAVTVASRRR